MLGWLKEWDKIVFGIDPPKSTFTPSTSPRKQFGDGKPYNGNNSFGNNSNYNNSNGNNSPFKGKKRFETKENGASSPGKNKFNRNSRFNNNNTNNNTEQAKPTTTYNNTTSETKPKEDNGMPKYKAVLLCGPPGLGKTTLAHVLARHAGYNPVEINARYTFCH